ncbi:MAG: DUF554 domain-containing protein [Halanaerobiales bacterium]|nr:DUF554 domain-containing protein [Halanaerobiales bacterium]
MIGTIVNVIAIVVGSILGFLLKGKLPERFQNIVIKGISLAVIMIGLQMALSVEATTGTLVVIFSLVIGGIIGEFLEIENRLESLGKKIQKRFKSNDGLFVQGFVQSSLIYCVGAMAIMGAIQDGLNNDPSILFTKSLLDGTASIAFSATFGIGVMFSAIPVLVYQGFISLLSSWAQKILVPNTISMMTATGGLLIMAIGINMLLEIKIKIGNLIPAIFVAIIIAQIFL